MRLTGSRSTASPSSSQVWATERGGEVGETVPVMVLMVAPAEHTAPALPASLGSTGFNWADTEKTDWRLETPSCLPAKGGTD